MALDLRRWAFVLFGTQIRYIVGTQKYKIQILYFVIKQ
jgi:hypothetical protein